MDNIMELRKSLLNEVASIIDDEELTRSALRSIRRLKAKMVKEEKEEEVKPYTMEELDARIDESEAEIRAGQTISGNEMNRRIEEYRAGLS